MKFESDANAISLRAWLDVLLEPPLLAQDCSCEDVMRRHMQETFMAHQRDVCGSIEKVSQRIQAGRIITSSTSSHSRLNATAAAVEALLSYDARWLKLALEHVVDLPPDSALSKQSMRQTLVKHLFDDPHNGLGPLKAVPNLLHVVALIDRAAIHRPPGTPLIFTYRKYLSDAHDRVTNVARNPNDSATKSSAAVLQATVGLLLGEADCGRHLARFGYKVSFIQTPLEEALDASMTISNLAVDFRDGVRLCRLAQHLTGHRLLHLVRFPAIKRPDRLHNVELALNTLAGSYSWLPHITPKLSTISRVCRASGIVDGDRNTTTSLLWHLVMAHHLPLLLTPVRLWAAVNGGGREKSDFAMEIANTLKICGRTEPKSLMHAIFKLHGQYLYPLLWWIESFLDEDEKKKKKKKSGSNRTLVGLLMDGTLVCRILGVRSWPERGQHRNYEIALEALLKHQKASKGSNEGSSSSKPPFWWSIVSDDQLSTRCQTGIQPEVSEACAIMFLSALCYELMEPKKEVYAATIIQRRWRMVSDPRVPAAVTIQTAWRGFLARRTYFDCYVAPRIVEACLIRRNTMVEAVKVYKELQREQEVEAMRHRLRMLANTMTEFAAKSAAATKIQRAVREYLKMKSLKDKVHDNNNNNNNNYYKEASRRPIKNHIPKEIRRPALRELTNANAQPTVMY